MTPTPAAPAPGFARQLAAMAYDALVVIALWFAAALPVVLILGGPPASPGARMLFKAYLLAVAFGFFGFFWVHGGQTVGMRAWRIRLERTDGGTVGWRQAGLRFGTAMVSGLALGLGYLWRYVDRERRSWHDRASGTRLRLLPKPR
jgi:uncharacterized RDD family membrane protein YckC